MTKMKKKEILFIIPTMRGAGAERAILNILDRIDYNKFNVSLLLFNNKGDLYTQIPKNIKKYHLFSKYRPHIPLIENRITQHFFQRVRTLFALNPFKKFDTIISFLEGEALVVHNMLLNRRNKNISWVHTNLNVNHWTKKDFKNDKHELKVYQKMDTVVFVSHDAQHAFEEKFSAKVNSKVIYNIIDREKILELSREHCSLVRNSKFVICNVGRLTQQKRQDRLIETITFLNHEYNMDVECWIIGQGELRDELEQWAKDLKIDNKIKFLGFKPNPYPYIANSDLFLLSSDTEGFSLVVCEALCLGKPIVSTNITGPNEILKNGGGILCDCTSISLANGVKSILSKKSAFIELEKSALFISESFSSEDIMNQIYEIL